MHSCIYRGTVRHRRFERLSREFRYPIRFLYVDLDELPQIAAVCRVFRCAVRRSRRSVARITWGIPDVDLATAVRQRRGGCRPAHPDGPIRLLTLWRSFGFYFSPVNFFFLFDVSGQVQAIVAEVTNTPWRERTVTCCRRKMKRRPGAAVFATPRSFMSLLFWSWT